MGPVIAGTTLLKNYIGGKWVEAECSGHIDVTNPATGEVIAESPLSTTAETNRAIAAAEEAFDGWRMTPASRRVAPLFKLAQLLRENEEEIARVLRPRGRFLLDLMNPHNASTPDPSTLREEGSFEIAEKRWFSQENQRVEKRIRLLDRTTGRESEYMESVRVYLEAEIIAILAERELKVEQVFGDFEGSAFATESPRLVLCGVRS
mgnify:CR=1 FL=1